MNRLNAKVKTARSRAQELIKLKKWPCYFFKSNTTGEKGFEEFFTDNENLDMQSYSDIGVIGNSPVFDEKLLDDFWEKIVNYRRRGSWDKQNILELYYKLLPDFAHKETGKYLDDRM